MSARGMFDGLALVAIAGLLVMAGCTHTPAFTDAAGRTVPGSIAAMETWRIGGVPQSVWLRGLDVRQPAVILLHGGPGTSESGLFRHYDAELERHFLMVYWEQRGTGRSYRSDLAPESMTIDRFERDLDEVVDRVRQRFGQDRVILLGHSWGTVLGTLYAYRHPEKVAAYVGVGQIANFAEGERLSYEWALAEARRRNHQRAIAELEAMNPRPRTVDDELRKGRWVEAFGGVFHQNLSTGALIGAALSTAEVNLVDLWKFGQGNRFSLDSLRPQYSRIDLTPYRTFSVPVLFFLGRYDWQTPSVLAERYFAALVAPCKRLVWFERSAHNPPFEEPDAFAQAMVTDVWPLAKGARTCLADGEAHREI